MKYDDLAGVSLFVKQSLNEGMLTHLESNIRTNLGIAVPSSVWDHVRRDPHALRSWMDRAVEYQGQCETFRQSAIRVARLERKSWLCISKLEREKVAYDFALNATSFNSTLNRILEQFGDVDQSRGQQTSTRSARNRTRSNQTRRSRQRTQMRTQTKVEPSAVESVKEHIEDLENQKLNQIGVLKDPNRSRHAKKGAKKHLNRIRQEIWKAKANHCLLAEEAVILDQFVMRTKLGRIRGCSRRSECQQCRPPFNKHLNGKLDSEIKPRLRNRSPQNVSKI